MIPNTIQPRDQHESSMGGGTEGISYEATRTVTSMSVTSTGTVTDGSRTTTGSTTPGMPAILRFSQLTSFLKADTLCRPLVFLCCYL